MEKYVSSGLRSSTSADDLIEVTIFDEPSRKIRSGYPDILNHSRHYRTWLTPSAARVQVVCHQLVLDKIQQHAKYYARQEIGGILIGNFYRADESGADPTSTGSTSYVEIHDYLPAPREGRGQSSASHITFTETIWAELLRDKDQNPTLNQMEIVGWFHSHPNWGTQPSSLDIDIQLEHFRYEWQVALIYDPQRHEGDFYLWDAQNLVRAPGFYEVFSRIKPEPVTNWRNYIALTQLQRSEQQTRIAKEQRAERVTARDIGYVIDDALDADDAEQTTSSIPQARDATHVATSPDRQSPAQISISRGDILKNFLRRRWIDIVLATLTAILIPLLAYLGYQSYLTRIETAAFELAQSNSIYYQQKFATGPTNYPLDFQRPGENQGLSIFVNGEPLGGQNDGIQALSVEPSNDIQPDEIQPSVIRSSICARDWRIGQALDTGAVFLLQVRSSVGFSTQSAYLNPTYQSAAEKTICFNGIEQALQVGRWNGTIKVIMPQGKQSKSSYSNPFVSFEPSLTINVGQEPSTTNEQ